MEINSSFYRLHRTQTYERWAASVPADFLFSAKVPKQITHELRLQNAEAAIEGFITTVVGLGSKLGVLLVQLPPSLELDIKIARRFFKQLRQCTNSPVVCEPRHASWFGAQGSKLLDSCEVGLVSADPPPIAGLNRSGATGPVPYFRLHGSPRIYYSRYSHEYLQSLSVEITARPNTWCVFDNTAHGWATQNALELQQLVAEGAPHERSA